MTLYRATTWVLLAAASASTCCGPALSQENLPPAVSRIPPPSQEMPYTQKYGVAPDPVMNPNIGRIQAPGNVDGVIQNESAPYQLWNPPMWNSSAWNPPSTPSNLGQKVYNYVPEGMIPYFGSRTPEERRHSGLGEPLEGMSWLDHQESAGAFGGVIFGATSSAAKLNPGVGDIFGLRFCWDYDHRWGLEKRFSFAQMYSLDLQNHVREIVNLEMGDIDLMFYPWGESRWRPYIMTGIGASGYNFQDVSGKRSTHTLLGVPFGIGVKYLISDGVAMRLDIVDNLLIGNGEVTTMNNMSITLGVEFRFDLFGGHMNANRTSF